MEMYSAATVSMFYINYGCSDMKKKNIENIITFLLLFRATVHHRATICWPNTPPTARRTFYGF
jgi:hypothetical protein